MPSVFLNSRRGFFLSCAAKFFHKSHRQSVSTSRCQCFLLSHQPFRSKTVLTARLCGAVSEKTDAAIYEKIDEAT